MNNEQLTAYLQDESYLYTLSYEELKTLVVQYPYAANLRILLLKKSHIEQNKDFDRNLQMAATYATNRRFLYKLVKKLKSLQAMPENVILAEDYLELTELSNIEKILSTRQVSETQATAENTRTLSADFSLNFETPTPTQEDDEALFGLSTTTPDKHNFDIMSDEEVDFLVDDIVSKFKNPTPIVSDVEEIEEKQEINERKVTVFDDFQAVFHSNNLEKEENTEGGNYLLNNDFETHDTNLNTHFFDDNDDPEWVLNANDDTLIEEEISKLEVFNLPLIGKVEITEIVEQAENIEIFQPLETTEIIEQAENIEIFQPLETTEIIEQAENIEIFQPLETTEIIEQTENIEIFQPHETTEIIEQAENIEIFQPLETTEIIEQAENIEIFQPLETTEIIEQAEFQPLETTKFAVHIENIEDTQITEMPEIVSHIEVVEDFEPIELPFIEYVVNENVSSEMQDLYYTSFSPILPEDDETIEKPILNFIEEVAPPKISQGKPIYGFVENIEQIELASNETPSDEVIENFKEVVSNNPVVSNITPISHVIEDFVAIKSESIVTSNEILQYNVVEDFKETPTQVEKTVINTPIYSVIEDFKGTKAQVENDVMGQLIETQDLAVKKKDNDKPVIELEIINHSKATLVESNPPPPLIDPSTSFSEWLQQFQKPKPAEIPLNETGKTNIKESSQNIDNQPIINKNKQRKYHLDSLEGIFETGNSLPDNLFYGLSTTDVTPNIVEKQGGNTSNVSESNTILNDFLSTPTTVSDDNDIEWLSMPLENNPIIASIETTEHAEEPEEHAPQKKKKKKMMHELAAQSLIQDGDIISEPLADIYAAQGLNDKAIEMYERLSLHIPEKSDFFAAKIEKLRTTT